MKLALRNSVWPSHVHELFDRFLSEPLSPSEPSAFVPQTDIIENENAYVLQLAAPGFAKDSFKLAVENRVLTVSGERKFENEETQERYHHIETRYGRFARTFRLPETVNVEAIEATYRDGLLIVTLPKAEPTKLITEISVN